MAEMSPSEKKNSVKEGEKRGPCLGFQSILREKGKKNNDKKYGVIKIELFKYPEWGIKKRKHKPKQSQQPECDCNRQKLIV